MRGSRLWGTAAILVVAMAMAPGLSALVGGDPHAPLRNVYLHGTHHRHVDIDGGFLDRVTLEDARVARASLREGSVTRSTLESVDLERTNLSRVTVTGFTLRGGAVSDSTLVKGRIEGATLTRVRLCDVFVADTGVYHGPSCAPSPAAPGATLARAAPHDGLWERDPIHIRGEREVCNNIQVYLDAEGRTQAIDDDGIINCLSADGSPARPYLLSGWRISTAETGERDAIRIEGVTSHIVVEDVVLAAPGGVALRVTESRNLRVMPTARVTSADVGYQVERGGEHDLAGVITGAPTGVRLVGAHSVVVDDLWVEASGTCIESTWSIALLTDVTATGCATGFLVHGGTAHITGSRAHGLGVAVHVRGMVDRVEVAHNRIARADAALLLESDGTRVLFRDNDVDAAVALAPGSTGEPRWYAEPAPGLNILGGATLGGNAWRQGAPAGDRYPLL